MSRHAVRWGAVGAIRKAACDLGDPRHAGRLEIDAVFKLEKLAGHSLSVINDHDGREAVVALFKKALAA